jgi:Lrp/AsnC family transcriptional regulator
MAEVMEFYRMAGDTDYLLRVVVADMNGFDGFYRRLTEKVAIKKVTSHFALENLFTRTVLPI